MILPVIQAIERDPRGMQLRRHRDVLVARADTFPPASAVEDSYRGPRIGRQYVVDRQRGGGRRSESAPSSDDFLTVQQLRAIPAMQSRSYPSHASGSGSEGASTINGYLEVATPSSTQSSSAAGEEYFARPHHHQGRHSPIGLGIDWSQQFDKEERSSLAKLVDYKHQNVLRRAQTLIGSTPVKTDMASIWRMGQQQPSPPQETDTNDPWHVSPAPIGSGRPQMTRSTSSPNQIDEVPYGEMTDVTQAIERLLKEKD